jgi:ParB/RepB/Spo0J family partition protein
MTAKVDLTLGSPVQAVAAGPPAALPVLPPLRLTELDPNDVMPAPGQRLVSPDSVTDLLASISKNGQLVPGICYKHPDLAGKYCCADGNRRLMAVRIQGGNFKTFVADRPLTKAEVRRIRLTSDIKKALTPDQIATDVEEHIAETGDSQEATAEFFGLSPGYVSKLLAPIKRLDPALRHLQQNRAFCRDVLRIIASMPTPEMQHKLAAKVKAIVDEGGHPKRDLIVALGDEIKGKTPEKKRKAPIKIKVNGASLVIPGDWAWDHLKALGDSIKSAAARGEKMEATTSILPGLFPQ